MQHSILLKGHWYFNEAVIPSTWTVILSHLTWYSVDLTAIPHDLTPYDFFLSNICKLSL